MSEATEGLISEEYKGRGPHKEAQEITVQLKAETEKIKMEMERVLDAAPDALAAGERIAARGLLSSGASFCNPLSA